jgi:hypothetical protein
MSIKHPPRRTDLGEHFGGFISRTTCRQASHEVTEILGQRHQGARLLLRGKRTLLSYGEPAPAGRPAPLQFERLAKR